MARIALVLVAAVALLAATIGSAAAAQQKATVRISGTEPYWVVGTNWRVRERVVVTVTTSKKTWQRVVFARTNGTWRFTVAAPQSGCDVVFARARGAQSGVAIWKRVPSCPQPIL